jgi:hypothetical protein
MLRIPTYSVALASLGVIIGLIAGSERLGFALGGAGALMGYAIWLRARVKAIEGWRPFHLGSIVGTVLCTVVAVGFGVIGLVGKTAMTSAGLWLVTLPIAGLAVWLQWRAAMRSGVWRLWPSAIEVGSEMIRSAFPEDAGEASLGAIMEIRTEAVKKAKHSASSSASDSPESSAATGRQPHPKTT